jgi:3-oxoacyl-[acyl-carrier protein] reductase
VAQDIAGAGGTADVAQVDALDEEAVVAYTDTLAEKGGGIDIALNAVGIPHVQGSPLAELSFAAFAHPISAYTQTNLLTANLWRGT